MKGKTELNETKLGFVLNALQVSTRWCHQPV